jgi:hypothetical protein
MSAKTTLMNCKTIKEIGKRMVIVQAMLENFKEVLEVSTCV